MAAKRKTCPTSRGKRPSAKTKYADPANCKYPIDTKKHVRAAIAYFSRFGHTYAPAKRRLVWGRIKRAAKAKGIEVSPCSGPRPARKTGCPTRKRKRS